MVPFLAMPMLGSRLKFRHLVSAFTAMAGIFLITRPGFSRLNTGDLLTLFCALAFAFQTVMVQKVGNRGNSLHLTLYQILFIAIFSIPIAGLVEGFRGIASLKVWALAGTVGLTSTGLAFWLQAHFQPLTSAQTAAVIYSLEPVFAALFANLILNEDLPQPLGAGLIIAGMILAEWKRR
jgi:drug/metabolite transporter (DMT)-like permease